MSLPKPYYDHAGITIYNCDCREVLPFLEPVDLVLTDPPYGIGEASGKNKSRGKIAVAKDYGNADWDNKKVPMSIFTHCKTISLHQVVFGGNYYDLGPTSCYFVWDKDNGATDFADAELAWTNLKSAVRICRYRWHGMLQEDMKNKELRFHPTQKPVPVMQWCINKVPDAKTILDPFMGSGTTLVAAKLMGRKAIGIEIEEKYCEIAVRRLAQDCIPGMVGE